APAPPLPAAGSRGGARPGAGARRGALQRPGGGVRREPAPDPRGCSGGRASRRAGYLACWPAYLETKPATWLASRPVTMLAGMIPPEKPPFRIANSTSSVVSLRWSRFGPWTRTFRFAEPCVPAALSVWHPAQRWEKSTAPRYAVLSWDTEIPSLPQALSPMAAATAAVITRGLTR